MLSPLDFVGAERGTRLYVQLGERMEGPLLWEGVRCLGASHPDPVEDGVERAGGTAPSQERHVLAAAGRWRELGGEV